VEEWVWSLVLLAIHSCDDPTNLRLDYLVGLVASGLRGRKVSRHGTIKVALKHRLSDLLALE